MRGIPRQVCLLSSLLLSINSYKFLVRCHCSDNFGISVPVTPKKNRMAFGSSGAVASSEWYDSKLPNCVDFDKPGMCLSSKQ